MQFINIIGKWAAVLFKDSFEAGTAVLLLPYVVSMGGQKWTQ